MSKLPSKFTVLLWTFLITVGLMSPACEGASDKNAKDKNRSIAAKIQPQPSLLPAWRRIKHAPVMQYYWKAKSAEERQMRFQDYLEMGFTGIYYGDKDSPYGGKLFVEQGMNGRMPQVALPGDANMPIIDSRGEPIKAVHPWDRSIFAQKNVEAYKRSIVKSITSYGLENLFKADETIVLSSWDEVGMFSRKYMEYGYSAKEEFIAYLKDVVFGVASPQRVNENGMSFNNVTGLNLKSWSEVPLPALEQRFEQPGLWKLWIDFHGYYTQLFFNRIGQDVSRKIGQDVEVWSFVNALAKWPGKSSKTGVDLYWQAMFGRVLTVEDCQADYPGGPMHYALTDQLSRRYGIPVIGWGWFWPWQTRHNDPREIGRAYARALGHNMHGLIFWIYFEEGWQEGSTSEATWEGKPKARAAVAYWHHLFQKHWKFLREANGPKAQVAVVRPRNTGNMYDGYDYLKQDFGWTCAALSEMQIPFEVIADNHITAEPQTLEDYRALIIPSASWESPAFRSQIASFIEAGGYVYTNADSFMLDTTTGKQTDFLPRYFGIQPKKKYKGLFMPSYESAAGLEWAQQAGQMAKRIGSGYEQELAEPVSEPVRLTDSDLAKLRSTLPAISGTGLEQELYDVNVPQIIVARDPALRSTIPYRTFHDIVTGEPTSKTTVLATYNSAPVAVETQQTLWTGFRAGFDHACLFPSKLMAERGEPVWPFDVNTAITAEERSGPRQYIQRIVDKAGIKPVIAASLHGTRAANIEVLIRQHNGNAMVFLINHEKKGAQYELSGQMLREAQAVVELRTKTKLTAEPNGTFKLYIPAFDVSILALGSRSFVEDRQAAQDKIKRPEDVKPMPQYKKKG